jgi:hypothetical protein
MSYEPPLKITIETPELLAQGYGVNSTGKRGGNLRIRCTNREYSDIQLEAAVLNLSLAMFCRSCVVQVAQRLKDHREAMSTDIEAVEEEDVGPR